MVDEENLLVLRVEPNGIVSNVVERKGSSGNKLTVKISACVPMGWKTRMFYPSPVGDVRLIVLELEPKGSDPNGDPNGDPTGDPTGDPLQFFNDDVMDQHLKFLHDTLDEHSEQTASDNMADAFTATQLGSQPLIDEQGDFDLMTSAQLAGQQLTDEHAAFNNMECKKRKLVARGDGRPKTRLRTVSSTCDLIVTESLSFSDTYGIAK